MNAEGSREPERYAHTFQLPAGKDFVWARNYFLAHVKPAGFVLEKCKYNHHTGLFFAMGFDEKKSCR